MPDALPLPEQRKPLTKFQFATLFLQQKGCCPNCGERLVAGKIIDEHLQPLDALGSNALDNRQLWCRPCATEKTKRDRKERDKGRRLRGEVGNGPKRPLVSRNTFAQSSEVRARLDERKPGKLQGQKFQTKLTRHMDGTVSVRRERKQDA